MKSSKLITLAAVLAFACAPVVQAKFAQEQTCTQGNGGHEVSCDTTNSGVQTTTTTGPKGQLQNDKTNHNVESSTCGPGNSKGC